MEATDIRDIKGLEHFSYSPLLYIIPAIALVVALLGLWLWFRHKRRLEAPAVAIPQISAHELALRALNALQQNDDWTSQGELQFHFALSRILRTYIEARFGIHATDMTTAEIIRILPNFSDFDEGDRLLICQLLNDTDLVKFADARYGQDYGIDHLDQAKTIVRKTAQNSQTNGVHA